MLVGSGEKMGVEKFTGRRRGQGATCSGLASHVG